jgi:hypothetical protein
MWEQFGTEMAFEQHNFLDTLEIRKKRLVDHFEANKDTLEESFNLVLAIFE